MSKKKKPVKKPSLTRRKLLFYLLAVFFVVGAILLSRFQQTPPCANSTSCINDLSGAYEPETKGTFLGQEVTSPPKESLIAQNSNINVLGAADNKRIYVNLTNQTLEAKEGDQVIMSFPISSGKWGRTPTGDFRIWIKLRYTRMQGGNSRLGTYYNLPNVPYTMYFYNSQIPKSRGYGLHGAYWHNNFGHPMSHGCINISPDNAQRLFEWATPITGDRHTTYASNDNPGTLITIFGQAPWE